MGTLRRIFVSPLPWALLVAFLALLPWLRNHDWLRDFYDYGLVIAGNARIGAGERPYVDFTTPIQTGIFLLNGVAEKAAGGDFLALTRGGAALILLAAAGFTLLLARRWPAWQAALLAAAVVVGSVSQHTIIWHNTLGVVCLTLVAWSSAIAPALRRATAGWHALVLLGLVLGGINKLNFHFLALGVAVGWAIYAWIVRGETLRRTSATLGFLIGAGVVVPIAVELAWTGASFELWLHNVVQLASGSRAEGLAEILSAEFYLRPMHDYYGELALPQVGALGLIICAVATIGAWQAAGDEPRPAAARLFAAGGGVMAFAGGAALTATNFEIAYVGFAAWAALAGGLCLGFRASLGPGWVRSALAAGLALFLVFAWESAWRGQRSQFGHAPHPRAAYVRADSAGPAFAYLRGVNVPPNWIGSFRDLAAHLPSADENGLRPVFYGPGLEFLERVFPARKHPKLPLWAHWRTSYGDREFVQLERLLGPAVAFDLIVTPVAWDYWDETVRRVVEDGYDRQYFGPVVVARTPHRVRTLFPDAIQLTEKWGGNTAVTGWDGRAKVAAVHAEADGKILLGRSEGEAIISFQKPVRRIAGEVVVHALSPITTPVVAEFTISIPGESVERWWADVALEPGEASKTVAYDIDCGGQPFDLQVRIPAEHTGKLFAGYRGPRITHAVADEAPPPRLRPGDRPDVPIDVAQIHQLWPVTSGSLAAVVMRGGRVMDDGVELLPGGELWLRFAPEIAEIRAAATPSSASSDQSSPVLRAGWLKGGRFDVMVQTGLDGAERPTEFRLWSPEPDGWFVFMFDSSASASPGRIILRAAGRSGDGP